jgi:hypothetical protein
VFAATYNVNNVAVVYTFNPLYRSVRVMNNFINGQLSL